MTDLEERVERVETENRWLKRIALVVVIAFAAVILLDWPGERVQAEIKAKRIEVLDENGTTRIVLGVGRLGGAAIAILDERSTPRAALGAVQFGTGLMVSGDAGEIRAGLGVFLDRHASIVLFDENGNVGWEASASDE